MSSPPEFFLFDLGKVLVDFDHRRACRQLHELTGVDDQRVWEILFDSGLETEYELGLAPELFCQRLRDALHTDMSDRSLLEAHADIFSLRHAMVPLVSQLSVAGYPLGILSNTCPSHWQHCCRKFRLVRTLFETTVLSFEVGAMKPVPTIFHAAIERAGVEPRRILFVDDIRQNVEAACAAGLDAVHYSTTYHLSRELMLRGVSFNF